MKCVITLISVFVVFACDANAGTANRGAVLCEVRGAVVQGPSGQPIRKVEIQLFGIADTADDGYQAVTDNEGKFSISSVMPGHYRLILHREGFLPQKQADMLSGQILSVAAGQCANQLLLKMRPAAIISGTVRDSDGDPVVGASVRVVGSSAKPGLGSVAPIFTNDRGEYRVGGLLPGRYFVLAVPRVQYQMPSAPSDSPKKRNEEEPYPTYYPGTPDKSQAVLLEVHSGDEISADVNIVAGPSFTIHGSVDGRGVATPNQQLALVSADAGMLPVNLETAQVQPDGSFNIQDVLPGRYLAQLMSINDSGRVEVSVLGNVEVRNMDLENVHLSLTPPSTILGSIRVEDQSQPQLARYHVVLVPGDADSHTESPSIGLPATASVRKDGSFEFRNVAAGTYTPVVWTDSPQGQNLFVKAASLSGRAADEGLVLAGGAYRLEILASTKCARLEGTVLDGKGQQSAGATVVAIPEGELRKRPNSFRVENADQNGHFQISGLIPGEYSLVAIQDLDEDYKDPEFLQKYGGADQTIRLSQGEEKNVSLKVRTYSEN